MWTGAVMPWVAEHAGQLFGQAHALDLGEIGRVFDHAVANDAGNGDADRVDRFALARRPASITCRASISTISPPGIAVSASELVGVAGIAHGLAGQALILQPAGHDVFGHYNADGGSHDALLGFAGPGTMQTTSRRLICRKGGESASLRHLP